jgi:hypothetical protein
MVVLVYNLSTQEEERGGLWVVGQSELYNKTLSQKKIKRKGGREEEREKERREGEEKGRKGVWREGGRERKKEKKESLLVPVETPWLLYWFPGLMGIGTAKLTQSNNGLGLKVALPQPGTVNNSSLTV